MSSKYLLPCSCGKQIPVGTSQAGQTIPCDCGESLEVPNLRAISQLEPLPRADRPPRPTARWDTRQGVLLLGAVIAVSGVILTGWFYAFRPRMKAVKHMSPYETWGTWLDLRRGADRTIAPDMAAYDEAVRRSRQWVRVTISVTVLGVIVMGFALVIIPRRAVRRRPPPRRPRRQPQPRPPDDEPPAENG